MTEAGKLPPPLPPRLDWFVHTQMGQLAQDGVPKWFHGAISREDAEHLLESQPLGSFLLRVSHSHVGYTLSYKAQSCCRHFMVKLLDDGNFVVPGQTVAHASLDDLVTFHQQKPIELHGELLTALRTGFIQDPSPVPSPPHSAELQVPFTPQNDPENVDYEDLFLYSYTLAEEAASPTPDPREHQRPSFCPVATPEEASLKPVLLDGPKESKPLTEMDREPTEDAPSSCPPKAPFGDACQKLWRNLKMLPEKGKRVQQQLKSQLTAVNLSSFWDARRSTVTHGSRARAGRREHSGAAAREDNICRDPFAATPLKSPSQPQAPRDRNVPSRKTKRSVSWDKVMPGDRSWHQSVVRALSYSVSWPEPRGIAEPQEDWLPEEYRPPPPFAPGYC